MIISEKSNEELLKKLQDTLEGCKKSLEAGSLLYKTNTSTAETIWKVNLSLYNDLLIVNYI
jgi:hypothetical protein